MITKIEFLRRRILTKQYLRLFGYTGYPHFQNFANACVQHDGRYLEVSRNSLGRVTQVGLVNSTGDLVAEISPSGEVRIRGIHFSLIRGVWNWLEN